MSEENNNKNMNPKVSIIVPVYNVEAFLDECVRSVLAQTYENIEIVLIDDGAKDNSGKMCDDYALEDERIVVIHKENGGLSSARNAGIEKATGDYLIFVDSDDVISPSMVETMVSKALEYDTDIVSSRITENRDLLEKGDKEKVQSFDIHDALKEIFYDGIIFTSASGKMYSKELWESIRFPVGMLFEDYATIYKVIMASKGKIVSFDDYNYYYRPNPNSITKTAFYHKRMQFYEVNDRVVSDVKEIYPDLLSVIRHRVTRQSISYFRDMGVSDYDNKEDYKFVVKMVRKGIFKYLFSAYAFKSRMYGLMIAIIPPLARKMSKKI